MPSKLFDWQVRCLDIYLFYVYRFYVPSVLWHCWLGGRKGIRPVNKLSGGMLAWLSVWSKVLTCIWPSWCHCNSLSLASVKSRSVLPFWYQLTQIVLEKGPLHVCVCLWFLHRFRDHASVIYSALYLTVTSSTQQSAVLRCIGSKLCSWSRVLSSVTLFLVAYHCRYSVMLLGTACIVCRTGSMHMWGVHVSLCSRVGPQQQTQCCRFVAVGPVGRRWRVIAARHTAA